MIFETFLPYLYAVFMILTCSYAIYRGHKAEYIGAGIIILASVATSVVALTFGASWEGVERGIFAIDMIALLALLQLTIASDRFWPMWVTAFHLVAISVHAATMVAPEIKPWAFAAGAGFWAYPMLLALAIGSHETVRGNRKEHRFRPG